MPQNPAHSSHGPQETKPPFSCPSFHVFRDRQGEGLFMFPARDKNHQTQKQRKEEKWIFLAASNFYTRWDEEPRGRRRVQNQNNVKRNDNNKQKSLFGEEQVCRLDVGRSIKKTWEGQNYRKKVRKKARKKKKERKKERKKKREREKFLKYLGNKIDWLMVPFSSSFQIKFVSKMTPFS